MEATMAREGTYRPVGFGAAAMEQFRLLWRSRRPLLLLVGMLGALGLAGEPWNDNAMARLFTLWWLWLLFVGPFWAFAVWYQEGPSNRLYFWSHPVSRTGHSLARVAAGALWLWVLYAALILGALIFATFDGDATQFGVIGIAGWATFFVSPLIGYLIISVLTVPSDYPIRWFLGLLFGIPITLTLLDDWLGRDQFLRWLLTPLTHEQWGMGVTMLGPFLLDLSELHTRLSGEGGGMRGDMEFDPGLWWMIALVWLLLWTGVVAFLASRHPDRFPRLRRSG